MILIAFNFNIELLYSDFFLFFRSGFTLCWVIDFDAIRFLYVLSLLYFLVHFF